MQKINNLKNIQQIFIKNIKNSTQLIKLESKPDTFEKTTQEGKLENAKTNALPCKIKLQFFAQEAENKEIISEEVKQERKTKLSEKNIHPLLIEEIAELDKTSYNHALELMEKGVDIFSIKEIAELDETSYNHALELIDKGVSTLLIKEIAELDETAYNRTLELSDKYPNLLNIKDIVELDDETSFDHALKLLDNDIICANDIKKIIQLEEAEFNLALALLTKGINPLILDEYMELENPVESVDKVNMLKANAMEYPELYVNGEFEHKEEAINEIDSFFYYNGLTLTKLSNIFDKETMNNLLRMRIYDANEYLHKFFNFDSQQTDLLKGLCSSCDINGKEITPTQKIEFIDLITSYKKNDIDTSKMYSMIEEGKIDISKLNIDLFRNLLKNCDLKDEDIDKIPTDKLKLWNPKYLHLLSKEIDNHNGNIENGEQAFKDILKTGIFGNFEDYIQDTSNKYGVANANTKSMFIENNLDYEAWLKPSAANTVKFTTKDENKEQLLQIAAQLTEDIEALRKTPAKGFVDKQLAKYITNDKFALPKDYMANKTKLMEFTENTQKQLESIFKRAESNLNNPQKTTTAQNTLTIKNHLEQRIEDIKKLSGSKIAKTMDITIKMWDRSPQKDLFQGNYSTCCIGVGDINGDAMPHYLMNTAFNMIELTDNKTGNTIGNALCYFVKDFNENPIFIIDNIEIRNSEKPSNAVGIELRKAIEEYASNVAKEVTGKNSTKICMSNLYNDVPITDLTATTEQISFLGDIDCDNIYMDLYGGWENKDGLFSKQEMEILKIK